MTLPNFDRPRNLVISGCPEYFDESVMPSVNRATGESAMERARQQQTVTIGRGLFLVRYATAEDAAQPPVVRVSPDPTPNKHIGILLDPNHSEPVLWQPDTCLVVRALAPGKLTVEVMATQDRGSAAAIVRIEPLTQGTPTAPLVRANARLKSLMSEPSGLRILGHVTGQGDQVVNANEWLAGPAAPARIEGIAIEWPDKPGDLEIRYAVKTAKPQPASGRPVELGSFAGTRGKAMPIVGVILEMSGSAAANLQFAVEAIFLAAPNLRIVGKRVVASGPTGREPLVGLRLGLVNAASETPHPKVAASKAGASADRIRVFRSRPKPTEPEVA
jgi:hypothetical protein